MQKGSKESVSIKWPDTSPYQPDPETFQGTESPGEKQVIIPGEKIMPQTVDPQTVKTGDR